MAIKKPKKQHDGVVTEYHRILFLHITTGEQNSISVVSYINQEARKQEKAVDFAPYRQTITYELPYDENMNIKKAYQWLKHNIDGFKDAIDILEEGQVIEDVAGTTETV